MTTKLLRHALDVRLDVAEAFVALYGNASHALWLDDHGDRGVAKSYLASGVPIAFASHSWAEDLRLGHLTQAVECEGLPLGVFFVLPYEVANHTLGLTHPGDKPDVQPLGLQIDRLVCLDHDTGEATLYALGGEWSGELDDWRTQVSELLGHRKPVATPVLPHEMPMVWRDSPQRYLEMIRLAQEAIRDGDAYQLCLTTEVSCEGVIDPVALHRVMRELNPTHHQALIRFDDVTLVSASPETFLNITSSGVVTTRPIKGTRPRGVTPEEDRALARDLQASEKEQAENLMIVDLMRNDLSPVCELGSISVPELLIVETYASVHQLVSTVEGQLRKDVDLVDVISRTFPAGSMTGAPKRRAVQLLAGWEETPRGYYSGVFGVWRPDGSSSVAMTIRTAVVTPHRVQVGVGGGITALSDPGAEVAEVGIKALPFMTALGHNQVQYS
jgi:para-aminobenzoate synthetase component I